MRIATPIWLTLGTLVTAGCWHDSGRSDGPPKLHGDHPPVHAASSPPRLPAPELKAVPTGTTLPLPERTPSTPDGIGATADSGAAASVGHANRDPEDDLVVGPPDVIPDCEAQLRMAGVSFRAARLPTIKKKGQTCGAPQVVEYLSGPEHISYSPHPVLTCQLALGLAHLEKVLGRTAAEYLSARVVSVRHGGTYSCRSMARFRMVSEHSYANAIDLYAFGLSSGETITVAGSFGRPDREPKTAQSRFLRELARRLYDEDVFSVVVTRFFDELHKDHIHVDMAHYRTDGTR